MFILSTIRAFLLLLVITLIGCSGSDSDLSEGNAEVNSFNIKSLSVTADDTGTATFVVGISAESSAVSFTAFCDDNLIIAFQDISNPNGVKISTSGSIATFTGQEFYNRSPISTNYPASPTTFGKLIGGNYIVKVSVKKKNQNFAPFSSVRLSYVTKEDSGNFNNSATVNINAILSGALADDPNNKNSIKSALGKVQDMYSSQDIELAINVIERPDFPSQLPNPNDADHNQLYEQISNSYTTAINLLFAVDVEKLHFPNSQYAQSGFIPTPAIPSPRSGIAFSIKKLAGIDGEFDKDRDDNPDQFQEYDDETLQMASVIAHEIGHALGLKNSVELQNGEVIDSDTFSDTASCIRTNNCESERDTNRNIMFPYTLMRSGEGNKFYARDSLSEQQGIVIKQNVLVKIK
ncbi:MAG: hypothetical protein SGJ02_03940 [bacterium]|nr:hypothetical protein [bacterium]